MTVLDDVWGLVVRLNGEAICDDCIADQLRLTVRQHANHKTRELAERPGFDRQIGSCSNCGKTKTVIRTRA